MQFTKKIQMTKAGRHIEQICTSETVNLRTPTHATCLILLRRCDVKGFEVLLMQRHTKSRNFAGAMVFPGGKVEPGDAAIAQASDFSIYLANNSANLKAMSQSQNIDFDMVAQNMATLTGAALRETFEEVGFWCGDAANALPTAQQVQYMRAGLAKGKKWQELCEKLNLKASVRSFLPWSRWLSPRLPNLSLQRYDTFFFISELYHDQAGAVDGVEAEKMMWATPNMFLQMHQEKQILLAPPQIMTLVHLACFENLSSMLAHAKAQAPYYVEPLSVSQYNNRWVCFPGDILHSEFKKVMPGPTRLLLDDQHFIPIDDDAHFFYTGMN